MSKPKASNSKKKASVSRITAQKSDISNSIKVALSKLKLSLEALDALKERYATVQAEQLTLESLAQIDGRFAAIRHGLELDSRELVWFLEQELDECTK